MKLTKRMAALGVAIWLAVSLIPPSAGAQGAINVLLIGVDAQGDKQRGRSDVMILARIDPAAGSIRLASFLRDLYVPVEGAGRTRLNAAYHYGGETLLKQTIEENFGVAIDRTVTVDFELMRRLVDAMGGVEIDIQEKEIDHLNDIISDYNSDHGLSGGRITRAGLQRLDGRQALCYSRIRKIDSDFQRTSRQQALIAAMVRQLSTLSRWQLLKLAVQTIAEVETDVTLGDLALLAPMLPKLAQTDIQTLQIPFEGAFRDETIRGMMVLSADLPACRKRLGSFLGIE